MHYDDFLSWYIGFSCLRHKRDFPKKIFFWPNSKLSAFSWDVFFGSNLRLHSVEGSLPLGDNKAEKEEKSLLFLSFYLRRSRQVIERWKCCCCVVVVVWGDYFEIMTLKVDLRSSSRSTCPLWFALFPYLPPIIFFGVGRMHIHFTKREIPSCCFWLAVRCIFPLSIPIKSRFSYDKNIGFRAPIMYQQP